MLQSVGDWAEKVRALGSSPSADKSLVVVLVAGGNTRTPSLRGISCLRQYATGVGSNTHPATPKEIKQ